ncbi:nucleoside recognition domain-containing protein [Cetobacterium sp. 2A]|uniref:nucleoside recognition domain-containing protein n=1 Tax=Cetobacterium sp. 2A TaxID=2754723 RepID=UPI00351BEB2B
MEQVKNNQSVVEIFMKGAKKGLNITFEQIAPAMILAYVLIVFLKTTGLMDIIATVLSPLMALFGLPGEASLVIIAAFFAKAAGAATGLMLYQEGILTQEQATILYPAVILMGTLVGHYARIVIVSGVSKKYYKLLLIIPLIDAALAMFVTRIILQISK